MNINCTLFFSLLFLTSFSFAQQLNADNPENNFTKEFSISVFTGFSFFGPRDDIETNMISSGLNDTSPAFSGFFFNSEPKDHPYEKSYPILNINATYYYKLNSGFGLDVGLDNHIQIFGYENIGIGNRLYLRSKLWSFSLKYIFCSSSRRHNLSIGPSLIVHNVKVETESQSPAQNIFKPGIDFGYSFRFIQAKSWFVSFNVNYLLTSKSAIGPFVVQNRTGIATSEPQDHISEFSATKVNLNSLNIGVGLGIRIY